MLNIRKLFKITKFGVGGGQYDGTSWWNWEKPVIDPDDMLNDPTSSLGFTPIQRAINVVANDIARVPLLIEKKIDDDHELSHDFPGYESLLNETTNSFFSSYEFRGWMTRICLLYGNSFALISRWGDDVRELIPVRPWDMTMIPNPDGGWIYRSGEYGELDPKDVIHLRMPTFARMLWGESPISVGRKAVALGMQQESAGRSAFAMPGLGKIAVLTKETLGGSGVKKLQQSFVAAHSGPEGMLRPIVVQNESEVKQVGQSLTDQDWIAARKFSTTQVSQLYGVPPQMLYNLDAESSAGQVQEQSRQYVDQCLSQYAMTWAAELAFKLLPANSDYRFRFDTTQLVRGTFNEQVAALQMAVQTGLMTRNEARKTIGLTSLPGGDEILIGPNLLPPEKNNEQAGDSSDAGQDDAGDDSGE